MDTTNDRSKRDRDVADKLAQWRNRQGPAELVVVAEVVDNYRAMAPLLARGVGFDQFLDRAALPVAETYARGVERGRAQMREQFGEALAAISTAASDEELLAVRAVLARILARLSGEEAPPAA